MTLPRALTPPILGLMEPATDTIVAPATPVGRGGIGIVRVSGALAPQIAAAILGNPPRPRHATFARFLDESGVPIDAGIALYFPAPDSFTGEDVLELHGHGGAVVADLLVRRALALGARLARPGEFTERAFLNDKIDLAQAEAIADLIEADDMDELVESYQQLDFNDPLDQILEALE